MITSGVGLSEERLAALVEAGLEHLQLSFQDIDEASANHIAGTRAHALKLALVPVLKRFPLAFTVNLVVHRMNLDRLEAFIALAEELAPDRLEIAHVQYYGWALKNRALLMPTQEQVDRSIPIVEAAKQRLKGKIHLEAVFPDYYASFPKACVGGWGRQMMLIDPIGQAMPCHAAAVIPGLRLRQRPRAWPGLDLDVFAGLQPFPRRLLDVGNLPRLPAQRERLQRLPLPGLLCSPATPKPSIPSAATARTTDC